MADEALTVAEYTELLDIVRAEDETASENPFTPTNLIFNSLLQSEFSPECEEQFKVTPYTKLVVVFDDFHKTFLKVRPNTPKYLITPESKFFMRGIAGTVIVNITGKSLGERFFAIDCYGNVQKFRIILIDPES